MASLDLAWARHGACVIGATTLWLSVLDRVGMALVGGHVWCGARGFWLLISGHAAPAAIVAVLTLLVEALTRRGRWGARWARSASFAVAFTLPVLGLYLIPVGEGLLFQGPVFFFVSLVAGTAVIALGSAYFAGRSRKWWHYAPWGPLSVVAGLTDATVYPALAEDQHLATYAVTVMAATWGVGLPIAALLRTRGRATYRTVLPVAASLVLLGLVPLWVFERGAAATVSPQLERLLRKAPDPSPPAVFASALVQPISASAPADRSASFPRGPGQWSVLFVTVDSLRADALLDVPARGFYLEPSDTPFLNEWLRNSFRFVTAYSQGNSTVGSFKSMLRGMGAADWSDGANIPRVARRLDLTTAAVVPPFFLEDWMYRSGILEFERFDIYGLDRQEQQVEQLENVLNALDRERFFIWTHFFCTHDPFYTAEGQGGLSLKGPFGAVGTRHRYREAIRWLDGQLARLIRALEIRGRKDSTVVVLAADHGEHVGDGLRVGHGENMHSEDIHVPLIIHVPGSPGAVIRGVVGNVDILPTLVDLLGSAPEPTHQGKSLLSLMQDKPARSNRHYYIAGNYAGQHALVTDDDLVVYDEQLGAFQRFAREIGAEHGTVDAWGRDQASDRTLGALLARGATYSFRQELESAELRETLHQRLADVGAETSDDDLDFLAQLAGWSPDYGTAMVLFAALDRIPLLRQKLRIIHQHFWRNPAHWSPVLGQMLVSALRTPDEGATVQSLSRYAVPLVAPDAVCVRLGELASSGDLVLIDVWLALIRTWTMPAVFAGSLAALVVKLEQASALSPARTSALLEAISNLRVSELERRGEPVEKLSQWVRAATADLRTSIAQRACRALGAIGNRDDAELLSRIADGKANAGVRRAAVNGYAALHSTGAVPWLKQRVSDPVLGIVALTELVRVGEESTAVWLDEAAKATSQSTLQGVVEASAKRLRRRLKAN